MDHDEATQAARAVTALAARLAKDNHLAAELQRARREFFLDGKAASAALPGAAEAAELRFQEWFTLERESEVLGAVPATVPELGGDAADFVDSQAGLWLVQSVTARTVEARDLQDGQTIDLNAPAGTLDAGDLVVGRVFAEGAGRWTPSTAAAIFRPGNEIAQAFLRDMQRVGLERRLHQVELERLLLMRPTAPRATPAPAPTDAETDAPLEHLEADLDILLTTSGSEHSAAAISQQLAMAVRPGPVLGPLLDDLAFDTSVDLDAARELLLAIWNAHHRARSDDGDAPAEDRGAPGETLGERLVRTLDEGLAQKRDVEELFAQLERMAGIEPDETDDDEADGDDEDDDADIVVSRSQPRDHDDEDADDVTDQDADGNLAALIEEYLWETGRSEDPAAADLRHFAQLQPVGRRGAGDGRRRRARRLPRRADRPGRAVAGGMRRAVDAGDGPSAPGHARGRGSHGQGLRRARRRRRRPLDRRPARRCVAARRRPAAGGVGARRHRPERWPELHRTRRRPAGGRARADGVTTVPSGGP